MYAGEIALLKKLMRVISYHERVLEQAILRLKTLGVAGGISPSLSSVREAAGGSGGFVARVREEFADGIARACSSGTVELKP
jgi:division protein CdvB (Snf7/Vps24/ESCRT-III family)